MALYSCKECGHRISAKGVVCQQCGARSKKSWNVGTIVMVSILGVSGILVIIVSGRDPVGGNGEVSIRSAPSEGVQVKPAEADKDLKVEYASEEMQRLAESPLPKAGRKTKAVAKTGVYVGMTPSQVLDSSWGKPRRINRTTTRLGTREQWVYGNGNYLYFENDVLTVVQN